jgi:SWI/SNF-related matrix-associated actin-dependent regulator of chromatin subfamily A3
MTRPSWAYIIACLAFSRFSTILRPPEVIDYICELMRIFDREGASSKAAMDVTSLLSNWPDNHSTPIEDAVLDNLLQNWNNESSFEDPVSFGQTMADPFSQMNPNDPFQSSFMELNNMSELEQGVQSWARNTIDPNLSTQVDSQIPESSCPAPTGFQGSQSEIALSEDSQDGRVCYGMIYQAGVKLVNDGQNLLQELRGASNNEAMLKLDLVQKVDYILLDLPSSTSLGFLSDKYFAALKSLLQWESVILQGVAFRNSLLQKIATIDKARNAVVQIDINVYGPPHMANKVGLHLSEHRIWLQRPDNSNTQFQYRNPQKIEFPELEIAEEPQENLSATEDDQLMTNQISELVQEIQNDTRRAARLDRVAGDHLKTPLLPHQEKALSFMLKRESGQIEEEFRLWKPTMIDGAQLFVHRITRARGYTRPDEDGGGLLSDEMGATGR